MSGAVGSYGAEHRLSIGCRISNSGESLGNGQVKPRSTGPESTIFTREGWRAVTASNRSSRSGLPRRSGGQNPEIYRLHWGRVNSIPTLFRGLVRHPLHQIPSRIT